MARESRFLLIAVPPLSLLLVLTASGSARVTVFGESAGAGAIAALMVMPLAKDLFSQAITHSVPDTYFSPDLARGISAGLLEPIGLRPTVAALVNVPPERLLEAMAQLDRRMPSDQQMGTISPVDGEMLPTDPWTGPAAGAGHDVPLIVGDNRDEWRLFLVRMFRMPSLRLAAAHTAGGGRTHLCELTWPAPASGYPEE